MFPQNGIKIGAPVHTWLVWVMICFSAFSLSAAPTVVSLSTNSSTVKIQEALDRLPAEGGEVVLAPGTYAIDAPLHLKRDHQTLRGSGAATILRLADRADCPVIILGSTERNPVGVVTGLRVEDLVIDGNRRNQRGENWPDARNTSGIQNNGIIIQAVSNSIVERVVSAHCRSGGLVTANGVRRLTVRDFEAFDNEFDGLACYKTEDSVFAKMNLHDNVSAGISLDLEFNHNVISNSTLAGNDLGIFMRHSCENEFRSVAIRSSRHDGVFMAQSGQDTPNGWQFTPKTECTGNKFIALEIRGCAGAAFHVNDASCVNNVIQGGVFSGNARGGLLQAVPKLVKVQGLTER